MPEYIQFDLFESAVDYRTEEIKCIDKKVDNVRKGLFLRFGELSKMYLSLFQRQEKIENRLARIENILEENYGHEIFFDGNFQLDNFQ